MSQAPHHRRSDMLQSVFLKAMVIAAVSGAILAPAGIEQGFGMVTAAGSAAAQSRSNVFTIERVPVDVTAESAASARTAAIASGQRKAFDLLLQRMVPTVERARLGAIDQNTVTGFVSGFEINNERTSPVRYMAELTVQFNGQAVRNFLRRRNVAFSETTARPVVVYPVLETAGLQLLWEQENAWRLAWARVDLKNRLVPFILPQGNAEDRSRMSAAQASIADGDLSAAAAAYGAQSAIAPRAVVTPGADGTGYRLAITAPDLAIGAPGLSASYDAADDAALAAVYGTAVAAILNHYDDWWKSRTAVKFSESQSLAIHVPLAAAADWAEVQTRLSHVNLVQKVVIERLQIGGADLTLDYAGSLDQLKLALEQANLRLEDMGDIADDAARPQLVLR